MPDGIPSHAIDFIKRCLTKEPHQRPSAKTLLEDDWCKQHVPIHSTVNYGRMVKVFGNLSFYAQANTGTTAICSFIGSMMAEEEDIQKIRPVFQKLDPNNDGYLTLEGLE